MNLNISEKKLIDLVKIFSPTIIKELSINGKSKKLTQILNDLNIIGQIDLKQSLGHFFNDVYKIIFDNYKNEYIYKNLIIKKILLGRHSLNTAFLLNELRVGNSKADSVIFNGTSTVYEIKSEYDTFNRLNNQIDDYKKAFEFIYIVIPEKILIKLENVLVDDYIGIIVLTTRNTLKKVKNAKSNKINFNKETLFDILNQNEYKTIVNNYFHDIPEVPNTRIYSLYKEYFKQLDIEIIHNEIVNILKKRGNNKDLKNFILNVPDSLKALALQINLTKKAKVNLLNILQREIKTII